MRRDRQSQEIENRTAILCKQPHGQ
jgi:hypothetical protein